MFGFMGFPSQAELTARKEHKLERLAQAEPWSETMAWKRELNIKADTYKVIRFFDGKDTESPSGLWRYEEKHLPRGLALRTHQGSREGSVIFDGPVAIPALFMADKHTFTVWDRPFMSLTPMEFFTLRAGTKLAKGHTVIAGLGMGHQLIEVSKKKSVKQITVVEKSAELVKFIWPEIKKHLPADKPIELLVGDAYEVLPDLTADVALVDIFPDYGSNRFEIIQRGRGWVQVPCPGIKRIWVWGAADVKGETW